MLPLAGIRVLDFSTLLPGPMAGLFLFEAGAELIKIERPGTGDELRTSSPRLGEALRDDARDPAVVRTAVAARIAAYPTAHWRQLFEGQDACCAIVANLAEAVGDPHVLGGKIFDRQVSAGAETIPALPVPIDPALRDSAVTKSAPRLGADSGLVGTEA
jgi:crotonobetainyl-CoA:carnitine CoA-transferase CaiB-like acyl-CoA transferase